MSSKQYASCLIKHLSETQSPRNTCVYTFSTSWNITWCLTTVPPPSFSEWCKNTRNMKHGWCKDCDVVWQNGLNVVFFFLVLCAFEALLRIRLQFIRKWWFQSQNASVWRDFEPLAPVSLDTVHGSLQLWQYRQALIHQETGLRSSICLTKYFQFSSYHSEPVLALVITIS